MEFIGPKIGPQPLYVKIDDNSVKGVSDSGDTCMKVAVASFEILTEVPSRGRGFLGGPRVLLHLHPKFDFTKVKVPMETKDLEGDVIALAATSVLKYLYQADCVGKDVLTFQHRRGPFKPETSNCSPINSIGLKANRQNQLEQVQRYGEGIISHTYAYIEERQLCLFLNKTDSETLKKIEAVLVKHFPKKV